MPGLGAIHRYFRALSLPCKLLKTSDLQFSLQESCKLFTVYSQNWLTETHTACRNPTFESLLLSKCERERTSNLKRQCACCVLGYVCCGGTRGAARLAANKRRISFAEGSDDHIPASLGPKIQFKSRYRARDIRDSRRPLPHRRGAHSGATDPCPRGSVSADAGLGQN